MANLGPEFNGNIFSKNFAQIIAQNRQQAVLMGVGLAYTGSDYLAGTVLARNTTSGYYQPYTSGGPSGTGTAVAILAEDHLNYEFASSGDVQSAVGIFGGQVFQTALIGLDSGAITNLAAKSLIDGFGVEILKF